MERNSNPYSERRFDQQGDSRHAERRSRNRDQGEDIPPDEEFLRRGSYSPDDLDQKSEQYESDAQSFEDYSGEEETDRADERSLQSRHAETDYPDKEGEGWRDWDAGPRTAGNRQSFGFEDNGNPRRSK